MLKPLGFQSASSRDADLPHATRVRVLVVEDDLTSAEIIEHALVRFGYEVTTATNGREALELIRTGLFQIVISDWEMPEMSGLQLCREIRQRQSIAYIYVILLTLRSGTHNVIQALDAGADEFISKPFEPQELWSRLRVAQRILSLESRDVTIFTLAKLAESRDQETGAHLERMREYCRVLAQHLRSQTIFAGRVDGEFVQLIYLTSPLHDIGKVGIPDRVLLKPGRLSTEEFEIMKRHTIIGGDTLDAASRAHPRAQYLRMARDIAYSHHEKYDGTGYPYGLKGEEIPLAGRIVALADVYDALTSKRVYKPAYSHDVARSIIVDGKGSHFDPDVFDAFLANERRFIEIHKRFNEGPGSVPTEHDTAGVP